VLLPAPNDVPQRAPSPRIVNSVKLEVAFF